MAALTHARSPLRQRPIFALVSAEVISSLGSQMTFLALPWFVLQTTGSRHEDGRRPRGRAPSDRDPRDPLRLRDRAVRRPADDARLRPDPRAPARLDPAAPRARHVELSPAARDRRVHRHLPRAVLRVAAPDPARARGRRRARGRTGERRHRGRDARHLAARACRRGPPDRGVQRAGRALRRRRDVPVRVRAALPLRPCAAAASRSPTTAAASSPGSDSCCATRCCASSGSPRSSRTGSGRCSAPGSPCSPTRSTRARRSPGRSSPRSGSAPCWEASPPSGSSAATIRCGSARRRSSS